MKQFVWMIVLIAFLCGYPSFTKAITTPCSMVLNPIDHALKNAKGVALVYDNIGRTPVILMTG
jgi:hypothetical protein